MTEKNDVEKIYTYCIHCSALCGVIAYVRNGILVKVEGDTDSLNNAGTLCPKGLAAKQEIYHPERLKYPMKRTNPKGDDDPGWVRITWDEALDAIVANMEKVIDEITQSIDKEVFARSVVLFNKPYLRLVLIGIAVGMFNQFTGINVVFYYTPSIFKSAGFGNESALMQTVIFGATNLVFTIIAMSVIDRLGRKFLLILGAIVMPVFLGLFAITFLNQDFEGYLVLIYLIGFVAFFASSQGVVIWVILAEMFPNNIRARASAIGSFSHWFFNALTAFLFPIAVGAFGIGYIFVFYTIATICSLFFFIKFLVETKGKTLEALEKDVLK